MLCPESCGQHCGADGPTLLSARASASTVISKIGYLKYTGMATQRQSVKYGHDNNKCSFEVEDTTMITARFLFKWKILSYWHRVFFWTWIVFVPQHHINKLPIEIIWGIMKTNLMHRQWFSGGTLNPYSWEKRACFHSIVNSMAADGLVTLGARAVAAVVLT